MKLPRNKKGLETLGKLSGLSHKAMNEIWQDVKRNQELLRTCSFHIFVPHSSPNMSRRFICENCKGVVGSIEKSWYEKGIEHSQPRCSRRESK